MALDICDHTCSDCMTSPPCAFVGVRIPCGDCNRHFRSHSCYDNHKKQQELTGWERLCEQKKCCAKCGVLIMQKNTIVTNTDARIVKKTKRSDTCVS